MCICVVINEKNITEHMESFRVRDSCKNVQLNVMDKPLKQKWTAMN